MKKLFHFALAAILACGTAQAACNKAKPASTPTSRFILKDGEAIDEKTHLVWSRCSAGATWKPGAGCVGMARLMGLDEARKYARQLGGGWRLPTIEELYGLVETRCSRPAINAEVFPNVRIQAEGAPYWSSSSIREMPPLVYFVDFADGQADGHTKGFAMAVRLVRNGK